MQLLIASTKRKYALEIGGASGYSAISMGQAMREIGGKLVTMIIDRFAEELAGNIRRAGLTETSCR